MCPTQGVESCHKHLQAQGKGQSCIPLSRGGMGTPGRIHHETGGKRVCGRFRSKCAYGQQERDVGSAELETMRISKKSDDGADGQRRGANKRRSHGMCQRIGHFRDSDAS